MPSFADTPPSNTPTGRVRNSDRLGKLRDLKADDGGAEKDVDLLDNVIEVCFLHSLFPRPDIKVLHKLISIPNGEILVTRYWQDESVGPFHLFAIDDRNLKAYNIVNGNMILKDTKSGHWTLRSPDSEGNQVLFKRIGIMPKDD